MLYFRKAEGARISNMTFLAWWRRQGQGNMAKKASQPLWGKILEDKSVRKLSKINSASLSREVWWAEGQLLISAKRRYPKPTNPCDNLKIFMKKNTLWRIYFIQFLIYTICNWIFSVRKIFYSPCRSLKNMTF